MKKTATRLPEESVVSRPAKTVSRRAFLQDLGLGVAGAAALGLPQSVRAAEGPAANADPKLFETIYSLRSIRRLKPDPIPEETLRKIVEAGIHAPSGGNRQDWGFVLVRDPELKKFIRDRYLETQKKMRAGAPPLSELPPERQRALKASMHLSEHMHEAPVLLLACAIKEYPPWGATNPRASQATVHGSIYPAVQNILLACRAFGVGATLTTTHCFFEEELKQKLGVPENMEISAMLPMGYPRGSFGKTKRKPVDDVLYWDRWGKKSA